LDEKREVDLKLNREYEWLKCAKQGSVILTNFKNKIFFCQEEKVIPCMGTRGFSCAVSGVGHVSIVNFSRGFATRDGGLRSPK